MVEAGRVGWLVRHAGFALLLREIGVAGVFLRDGVWYAPPAYVALEHLADLDGDPNEDEGVVPNWGPSTSNTIKFTAKGPDDSPRQDPADCVSAIAVWARNFHKVEELDAIRRLCDNPLDYAKKIYEMWKESHG